MKERRKKNPKNPYHSFRRFIRKQKLSRDKRIKRVKYLGFRVKLFKWQQTSITAYYKRHKMNVERNQEESNYENALVHASLSREKPADRQEA